MPSRKWTKELVKLEIRKLYENGEDLTHSVVLKNHPALEGTARNLFQHSWLKAVDAAGIDSSRYRRQKVAGYWTPTRVTQRIRERRDAGLQLTYASIRKEDPLLESAAQKTFGGWYNALDAAGIDSSQFRRQEPFGFWTRERVMQEIRKLNESNSNLNFSYTRKTYPSLAQYAIMHFGGWYQALEAAGIDSRVHQRQLPPNYWDRNRILQTLKTLNSQLSAPVEN